MPFSRSRKVRRTKPRKAPGARKSKTVTKTVTTMGRIPRPFGSKGPFPKIFNTQLVYKNPSATITSLGLSSSLYLNLCANNMFRFDTNANFGNKQPLFFDQLCSATGPYRWYKVNAWKTTIKLINLTDKAMYTYYDPAASSVTETDTSNELENRRGVKFQMLTAQGNAKPMVTYKTYRTLKSFAPQSVSSSENYSAEYNAEPAQKVFQTLMWRTIDGSTAAYTVAVQVSHVFYCTFYNADSAAS